MFFCYILECADGTYYTGWTTDPQRRLRQHNSGRGARYTRTRGPLRLVYLEEQPDRRSAMLRELAIKALSRAGKQKIIDRYTPMPIPIKNQPLPLEEVARYPLPGMSMPSALAFSPDDRLITCLASPAGDLVNRLYALDSTTLERRLLEVSNPAAESEDSLSPAEKLRRERQRQRELGVTRYAWAKTGSRLLIPLGGSLYVKDGPDGPARLLVDGTDHPVVEAQLTADGSTLVYVQENELFSLALNESQPRQLTFGAAESGKTHGLAEYIAQEEMGRSRGFWVSPDGGQAAFVEVDENHIPVYRIMHQGKEQTGAAAQEDHRYPFAGAANARVRLGLVALGGGEPRWLDLGNNEDIYLARVHWLPDGSLVAEVQNRAQNELCLQRYAAPDYAPQLLLKENGRPWINLHNLFRPLKSPNGGDESPAAEWAQKGAFIWGSERSGFMHLYLYDSHGQLLHPLTQGEWLVDEISAIDEKNALVYFCANRESPLERQLYAVSLAGGEIRRISQTPGIHGVVIDHAMRRYLDIQHTLKQPPHITLRSLEDDAELGVIHTSTDERIARYGLQAPELVELTNRAGVKLYGALYRPLKKSNKPLPLIVQVYGGPHVQLVANSWALTANMRAQSLARQGYLVFILDNRGSARRGLAFEGAIHKDMGHLEVEDQEDGVRWLVTQGLADPQRVGIYGWSYGGYMAAMCLARAPETFTAAVAGAPVSAWDGYDTHYTERYMGTPENNPEGYRSSSVLEHVADIKGRLLLVHGLIDENVHFRHTARLINALIRARIPYELLLFPDERHMPRRLEDRVFMEEQIVVFFSKALKRR